MYVSVLLISVCVRGLVGIWNYSGKGKSPMFGDYEAQRHWMEITTALPIGDWYKNTADNELQYWGLDYPPLTAYVSQLCGVCASAFVPDLIVLHKSRGNDSVEGKLFMRLTVIVLDLLLLIPCMGWISRKLSRRIQNGCEDILYPLSCLLLPGLLLIDHGHFQYNGVCLALSMLGIGFVSEGHEIAGSVFYCLSLNFKQMSLYYAPVFFCFLLRRCLLQRRWLYQFMAIVKLGITVVTTFLVLWWPFCVYANPEETCITSLLQVLHRQFPFARGIFEDKVANIWYTLSVIIDFRTFMSHQQLIFCSLGLTLLLLAPTCFYLLTRNVSFHGLLIAMMNSSLAFFLASFQVHEKSILLMLIPAAPLILLEPIFITWVQLLGTFTMFPLLVKDDLVIPYWSCNMLYIAVAYWIVQPRLRTETHQNGGTYLARICAVASKALDLNKPQIGAVQPFSLIVDTLSSPTMKHTLIGVSLTGMCALHVLERTIEPPAHLPHLYPALFSIYGAVNLCAVYIVGVCWMWRLPKEVGPDSTENVKSKIN